MGSYFKFYLSLFIILFFGLTCKSSNQSNVIKYFLIYNSDTYELSKPISNTDVRNHTNYAIASFDSDNKLSSVAQIKKSKIYLKDTFNESGKIIKRQIWDKDKVINYTNYYYNENNYLIKTEWYNITNNDRRIIMYEYDKQGRLVKISNVYNGVPSGEEIIRYGNNGKIEEKRLVYDGVVQEKYRFYYHSNGMKSREEEYAGRNLFSVTYYDTFGNITKKVNYDEKGNIVSTLNYDKEGKIVK